MQIALVKGKYWDYPKGGDSLLGVWRKFLPRKRYLETQLLNEKFTTQFGEKDMQMLRYAVPGLEVST